MWSSRYLRYLGYEVTYVRNITDIDDKIIQRAQLQGEPYHGIAQHFTQAMHDCFAQLQLLSPTHEPCATDYIPQIIQLITDLLAQNTAYLASNGDVYFSVKQYPAYGALSGHTLEALQEGARVEVVAEKQDPHDFVLWKLSKPGEPAWDAPWGKGRPGWHIECSAMSLALLGEQFDLHAGGRDLIFPHHENELAQSQSVTGKQLANIWMHTGYLEN